MVPLKSLLDQIVLCPLRTALHNRYRDYCVTPVAIKVPKDPHLPLEHDVSADYRDEEASDEHNDGGNEAGAGRRACRHALARRGEVKDVARRADLPLGDRTDTETVDGVPLHAVTYALVTRLLVTTEALAAARLVDLVGGAVLRLDWAVTHAAHVLLNFDEAALGLCPRHRKLRDDDHDLKPLHRGRRGHAPVRVQVAAASASFHGGKVRNYLDDVAGVGHVLPQIDEGVSSLAARDGLEDVPLLLRSAAALGNVLNCGRQ